MGISRISIRPSDPCKRIIMKKLCLLVCLTFGLTAAAQAEGNPDAGKAKSAVCAACHGPDGNSMIELNPKIAGQHENYLVKPLTEFRLASSTVGAEARNHRLTSLMVAALSYQDIAEL